ncbi:MAG: hypothetical protein K2N44_08410 [Lachnospiraceae bacterium]|nr:hypothetical protein [Lachnospiraceae bacterium]
MMNSPLAIERFQNEPEFQKIEDKGFLQLFINAVNATYEIGKRVAYSGFCLTVGMVRAWQKRDYGREMDREADKIFLDVFTEYSNDAYQQGVRASGRVFDIPADAIKIFPCFAAHSPKAEKMEQKERYFMETGLLQSQIILDSQGSLVDGYTSYLLAVKYGLQSVPVRYDKRQIVRASHKSDSKLYTWELPGLLVDRVQVGDRVLVRTEKGVRAVTVAAVEEYAGNEPEPLRMVIRVNQTSSV